MVAVAVAQQSQSSPDPDPESTEAPLTPNCDTFSIFHGCHSECLVQRIINNDCPRCNITCNQLLRGTYMKLPSLVPRLLPRFGCGLGKRLETTYNFYEVLKLSVYLSTYDGCQIMCTIVLPDILSFSYNAN